MMTRHGVEIVRGIISYIRVLFQPGDSLDRLKEAIVRTLVSFHSITCAFCPWISE